MNTTQTGPEASRGHESQLPNGGMPGEAGEDRPTTGGANEVSARERFDNLPYYIRYHISLEEYEEATG